MKGRRMAETEVNIGEEIEEGVILHVGEGVEDVVGVVLGALEETLTDPRKREVVEEARWWRRGKDQDLTTGEP